MKKFKSPRQFSDAARLKIIASGTAEIFKLDPRIISREPGFNTRYDFGDIAALAEDIAANGVIDPLKVRKDGATIYLVNGDRRLTAVESLMAAGRWPEDPRHPGFPMPVPCSSEGKGNGPADRIFMMLSLNTGKPFTLLEKGFAYVKLLDQDPGLNASEIARRTGETKQAVSNALTLIRKGSPAIIDHIKRGAISATTSLEIIKAHPDHSAQDSAVAEAISSATANGRNHATPKNLPKKPPTSEPPPTSPPQPADPPPFIADLSDESDPSAPSDSSVSSVPSVFSPPSSPDTPPDPAAYDRLKSAPSTHRDGSSGSGPAPAYASYDDRLKKLEKLMDELDPDTVNSKRWNTAEIILDYLQGNRAISDIRQFLTQ